MTNSNDIPFSPDSPIFVDGTGRRKRRMAGASYLVAAVCLTYVVAMGVSVATGSVTPPSGLPLARPLADLLHDEVTGATTPGQSGGLLTALVAAPAKVVDDLAALPQGLQPLVTPPPAAQPPPPVQTSGSATPVPPGQGGTPGPGPTANPTPGPTPNPTPGPTRSEEHTSELQSPNPEDTLYRVARGEAPAEGPRGRFDRSEERRVGKECRSRWSPYH